MSVTPWNKKQRGIKNKRIYFVLHSACTIFAMYSRNSRAQDIVYNLLNRSRITTSEQKRAK